MPNGQSMKNETVRALGRQIENLEDQIDAAPEGEDTSGLEAQLADLETQLHAAQQAKRDAQKKVVADRKAARDAKKAR